MNVGEQIRNSLRISKVIQLSVFCAILAACGGDGSKTEQPPAPSATFLPSLGSTPTPVPTVDSIAPEISLVGDQEVRLRLGLEYEELGAIATDEVDGELVVTVVGHVDSSIPGTYELIYSAIDHSGNSVSISREVTVYASQTVSIQPTASNKSIVSLVGADGIVELDTGQTKANIISEENHDFLIAAINEDDDLEFLAISFIADESVDIGAESTAFSLMTLFPHISDIYANDSESIIALIAANEDVLLLADVIANTPSWPLMENADFIASYQNALLSVLEELNEYSKTKPVSLAKPYLSEDDFDKTKSGVSVDVTGESNNAESFALSIKVKNDFVRWVKIVVEQYIDANSDEVVEIESFDLASNTEFSKFYSGDELASQQDIVISALGPGIGSSVIPDNLTEYYYSATFNSLLVEVALPTIGVITGSGSCIKSLFDPKLGAPQGVLNEILKSNEIAQQIDNGEFEVASLELVILLIKHIDSGAVGCLKSSVAKELAKYLVPVLGKANLLLKTAELSAKLAPYAYDWTQSGNHEQWYIENKVYGSVFPLAENFDETLLWGRFGYVSTENLGELESGDYKGSCQSNSDPSLGEITICEGYSFDHEGPYRFNFSVQCQEPDYISFLSATYPCEKVIFTPDTGMDAIEFDANDQGDIVFGYDYSEAKEYISKITLVDVYGAESTYKYHVQTIIPEPAAQLVIRQYQGVELPHTVTNSHAEVTETISMTCCEPGQYLSDAVMELYNRGTGPATVSSVSVSGGLGRVFVALPAEEVVIPPSESTTLILGYKPELNDGATRETITIEGVLGEKTGSASIDNDYTSLALNIDAVFNSCVVTTPPEITLLETSCGIEGIDEIPPQDFFIAVEFRDAVGIFGSEQQTEEPIVGYWRLGPEDEWRNTIRVLASLEPGIEGFASFRLEGACEEDRQDRQYRVGLKNHCGVVTYLPLFEKVGQY